MIIAVKILHLTHSIASPTYKDSKLADLNTLESGSNPLLDNKTPEIFGHCDTSLQAVADVFEQNLSDRGVNGDVGAACAVMIDGELVVDLWGGYADVENDQVWQKDTLCCCWSVSKSIGAILTLMMVDRGLLDIEKPVATYWPAFEAHGKEHILVRQLLDHTAGLSFVDPVLQPGDANDWDTMIEAIEQTAPNWRAGSKLGYLNQTQGYLLGELCAQVNGGRRLAQFLKEELAGPFGIDWHFAIPTQEFPRLATVYQTDPGLFTRVIKANPESTFAKSMKGRNPDEIYNSAAWRSAENGAGTSHTNARAMATLYGVLAKGGHHKGRTLLSSETLSLAQTESVREVCAVNGIEMRFSLGFEMNCPPTTPMGPGDSCFGYIGAGGSYAFADPDLKLGFGFSHNVMHSGLGPGPCGLPLVEAVMDSVYKQSH